ncbi:MAG TPA: MlaD family protein [Acidimicrobiales bacterium]|nr:MlaD family protein [Acidimicrobiales bacterium]
MMHITRPRRIVVALGVTVLTLAVVYRAVGGAYDFFSTAYPLSATFPHLGQNVHPGSEVDYRGVQVGKIKSWSLVDRQVQVKFSINKGFKVPADATATLEPQSVFGSEIMSLDFPSGQRGPFLSPGGAITRTATTDQVQDFINSTVPLFQALNPGDVQTIISELTQASQNLGPTIAQSMDTGTQLADLYSNTINAQINALDAFNRFQAAFTPTASNLNAIAAANNKGLPVFNQAEATYQAFLTTLKPLADNLAQLLSTYRPDINILLGQGDNVMRVLLARQSDISDLIHGLYRYTLKFAKGASTERLADGSRFAYFQTFTSFSDINKLVCSLVAPAGAPPQLQQNLAPLQAALGPQFDCAPGTSASGATSTGSTASSPSAPPVAGQMANSAMSALGQPQVPQRTNAGSVVNGVLGR